MAHTILNLFFLLARRPCVALLHGPGSPHQF
ncbi:unnamed protein product [Linum tenue]|uniref:Uncharacterized protein n=1 Tax=Linum tenue TaxID=586396 RepID=A0AAV0IQ47_9ROSI|nr:unnamed protein product [Linum tenue]